MKHTFNSISGLASSFTLQELRTFRREVEVLKELEHIRIIKYFGSSTEDELDGSNDLYIFMEYMPGVRCF